MKPRNRLSNRITASFKPYRWWHGLTLAGLFDPEINTERPAWVRSRKRRPGETLGAAVAAREMFVMLGASIMIFAPCGVIVQRLKPDLWWWSIIIFVAFGIAVAIANIRTLRRLYRGYWSERLVGEYLDGLERTGARVLHDLEGDGFNIDHLVVAKGGLYVIETKGIRPPKKGKPAPIVYRNGKLTLGGRPLASDPLRQVRQAATATKKLVVAMGEDVPIRPVVIIPGRYIEGRPSGPGEPWVLAMKGFPKWMTNDAEALSEDGIRNVYQKLRARLE